MPATHVITGATGFVGAALVLELLQRTEDRLVVLVRPRSAAPPAQRLRASLAEAARAYRLDPAVLDAADARCTVVAADLTAEGCGLDTPIDGRGSRVWHCAASLNYEDRHRVEIHATNVEGTRRALALAEQLGARDFNYVSTAYVAGKSTGTVRESYGDSVETNNHYERSKLAAERLVLAAGRLRRRILRPGIVIGHSRTLGATTFSGYYGFLRQLVQFRGAVHRAQQGLLDRTALRLRADPELGLNLIPIDSVAHQLATIGLSDDAEGIFHVTHPDPPRLDTALRIMFNAAGLRDPEFVPDRTSFEWLDQQFDRRLDFFGSYLVGDKRFDRARSDAALGEARRDEPPLDEDRLAAHARWYVDRLKQQRAKLPAMR